MLTRLADRHDGIWHDCAANRNAKSMKRITYLIHVIISQLPVEVDRQENKQQI
jgi:hypothetical protein